MRRLRRSADANEKQSDAVSGSPSAGPRKSVSEPNAGDVRRSSDKSVKPANGNAVLSSAGKPESGPAVQPNARKRGSAPVPDAQKRVPNAPAAVSAQQRNELGPTGKEQRDETDLVSVAGARLREAPSQVMALGFGRGFLQIGRVLRGEGVLSFRSVSRATDGYAMRAFREVVDRRQWIERRCPPSADPHRFQGLHLVLRQANYALLYHSAFDSWADLCVKMRSSRRPRAPLAGSDLLDR